MASHRHLVNFNLYIHTITRVLQNQLFGLEENFKIAIENLRAEINTLKGNNTKLVSDIDFFCYKVEKLESGHISPVDSNIDVFGELQDRIFR